MHIEFQSVMHIHEKTNFIFPTSIFNYLTSTYHSDSYIITSSSTLDRIVEAGTFSTFTNPAAFIIKFPDRDSATKLGIHVAMLVAILYLLICPTLKLRECRKVLIEQLFSFLFANI